MGYDHEIKDATFAEDLERSKVAVNRSAEYFSAKGYPVIIEPTFLRPDFAKMHDYSDDGDLKIVITCEIKHRPDIAFTGADDFPYPSIIVDTCRLFQRHKTAPFWYLIWNRDYTCFALVDVRKTFKFWVKKERYDKKKGRMREFYELDTSLVKFINP